MRVGYYVNLIFIVICALGSLTAYGYYKNNKDQDLRNQQEKFTALTKQNTQDLSRQIKIKEDLLRTISDFFQASESVSEKEFTLFTFSMIQQHGLVDICLIKPSDEYYFSVKNIDTEINHCEKFDLLEKNKVLLETRPLLMLADYIELKAEAGYFAAIIVPIDFLISSEQNYLSQYEQYLMLFQRTDAHTYLYNLNTDILSVNEIPLFSSAEHQIQTTLNTYGDVEFIYLSALPEGNINQESENNRFLISILIVISSLLIAFIIRTLLVQKDTIQKIVNHRTEELSQFAYRTSHDLKSPLTTIKRLAEYAEKDIKQENQTEAINNIQKVRYQANKLEQLVKDILDLARADLTQTNPIEEIDFHQLIDEIRDKYASLIEQYDVEILLTANKSIRAYCESTRLKQILENIISNAVKYSDPAKNLRLVEIEVITRPDFITIKVSDNGLGIHDKNIHDIYDHFTRYHPEAAMGTGMGLTITKRHIDKMGGVISVSSDDNKTQFTIKLPNWSPK